MAETGFDFNSFSIEDTRTLGDIQAVEDFLSSTDGVTGDTSKLENIKPEDKTPIKKKEEKKEEEEGKEEEDIIKDPLAELEDKKKEEDKEEGKEEKEEKEETKEEDKSENSYEELYKDLLRLGVFTQQEGESPAKTGEELLTRFQVEAHSRATQWLDDFLSREGEDRRELFDAIFIKGVSPDEYLPVYNQVQNFEGLDLTVEENQKRVYREFYRRVGMDEQKTEKRLQKTIDMGDLESEVPDLLEKIVLEDKQSLKDMEDERFAQKELQKRLDTEYKTGIQNALTNAVKNKEIKGVPVTDKRAREAFDFLYTPRYKTPNGQLLTEFDKFILESKKPENISDRLLIALLKLDGFDFKNIKKQAISEESKELFNSLATKVSKEKARATKPQTKEGGDLWKNL